MEQQDEGITYLVVSASKNSCLWMKCCGEVKQQVRLALYDQRMLSGFFSQTGP